MKNRCKDWGDACCVLTRRAVKTRLKYSALELLLHSTDKSYKTLKEEKRKNLLNVLERLI